MTKLFENAMKSIEPDGNSKVPGPYEMTLKDLQGLYEMTKKQGSDGIFWAIHYAFQFGFVMGNRATITRKLKRL